MTQLTGWNGCDGVVLVNQSTFLVVAGCGPMQLSSLLPLHTLIACPFEGHSARTIHKGSHVDKHAAINSLPSEVEVFISLDVEHKAGHSYTKLISKLVS